MRESLEELTSRFARGEGGESLDEFASQYTKEELYSCRYNGGPTLWDELLWLERWSPELQWLRNRSPNARSQGGMRADPGPAPGLISTCLDHVPDAADPWGPRVEVAEPTGQEEAADPSAMEEAADRSADEGAADPNAKEEAADPSAREEAADPSVTEGAADTCARKEAADTSVKEEAGASVTEEERLEALARQYSEEDLGRRLWEGGPTFYQELGNRLRGYGHTPPPDDPRWSRPWSQGGMRADPGPDPGPALGSFWTRLRPVSDAADPSDPRVEVAEPIVPEDEEAGGGGVEAEGVRKGEGNPNGGIRTPSEIRLKLEANQFQRQVAMDRVRRQPPSQVAMAGMDLLRRDLRRDVEELDSLKLFEAEEEPLAR